MATLEDKLVYLSNKIKAYGIAAGDEEAFNIIVEAIELIQCLSKKKNNWWPHAGAGSWNKLDSITTGHTGCEKCNGTGAIPFETFEPGTMKFDTAWIKCDWCNNVQNNSRTRG